MLLLACATMSPGYFHYRMSSCVVIRWTRVERRSCRLLGLLASRLLAYREPDKIVYQILFVAPSFMTMRVRKTASIIGCFRLFVVSVRFGTIVDFVWHERWMQISCTATNLCHMQEQDIPGRSIGTNSLANVSAHRTQKTKKSR
jgi:hypothetical protein